MGRSRCTFRQADVTRALRAAEAAGIEVGRIEIAPDGRITLVPKGAHESSDDNEPKLENSWDTL
jgi:hypothetical protein